MTVEQLATALHTNVDNVRRWIREGKIDAKLPYNSKTIGYRIPIEPLLERFRNEGLTDRVILVEQYLAGCMAN